MSSNENLVRYPAGFVAPSTEARLATLTPAGDEDINALWREYMHKPDVMYNPDYVLRLVKCAKALFGDFTTFFKLQNVAHQTSDAKFTFLQDLMRFIATGQRQYSSATLIELIEFQQLTGAEKPAKVKDNLREFLGMPENIPRREYLFYWVNRNQGLQDLLVTTHFIFGSKDAPKH